MALACCATALATSGLCAVLIVGKLTSQGSVRADPGEAPVTRVMRIKADHVPRSLLKPKPPRAARLRFLSQIALSPSREVHTQVHRFPAEGPPELLEVVQDPSGRAERVLVILEY